MMKYSLIIKKAFYLYCFLFCFDLSAQERQNNNWVFGINNWVSFAPVMEANTIPATVPFVGLEGCASVSDRLGRLILFTDGRRLWHRADENFPDVYTEITDDNHLLLGTPSSAQNVIFVPVPDHQDRYYIFTISGRSRVPGDIKTPSMAGLHYSVVDLNSDECGPGFIEFNVPLRDHLGNDIDTTYGNWSEALTSTVHATENEYWLLTHVETNESNGFMYSFLINENGVGINRMPNSNIPREVLHPQQMLTPTPFCIKVAPMGSSPENQNLRNLAMTCGYGGLFFGSFDNSTGALVMNDADRIEFSPVPNPPYVYGLEFSPNGNVLYYSRLLTGNEIVKTSFPPDIINNISTAVTGCRGFQMGMDGNIYVSQTSNSMLTRINNANSLTGPIVTSTIPLSNNGRNGLPQWVHKLSCESTLTDDEDIPPGYGSVNERRSGTVFLTNTVQQGMTSLPPVVPTQTIYHAGNFIEMLPESGGCIDHGFEAEYGSQFVAEIAECDTAFIYKNGVTANQPSDETKVFVSANKINIFPNPSNTSITISYNDVIKNIRILSMDGKTILSRNANEKELQIDVFTFVDGIYLITVETQNGQFLQSKFIKN